MSVIPCYGMYLVMSVVPLQWFQSFPDISHSLCRSLQPQLEDLGNPAQNAPPGGNGNIFWGLLETSFDPGLKIQKPLLKHKCIFHKDR